MDIKRSEFTKFGRTVQIPDIERFNPEIGIDPSVPKENSCTYFDSSTRLNCAGIACSECIFRKSNLDILMSYFSQKCIKEELLLL